MCACGRGVPLSPVNRIAAVRIVVQVPAVRMVHTAVVALALHGVQSGVVIDMGLGELLIRNSVFTNNHAGGDGGGIRTLKVGAIIRDSAFDGQVWSHLAAAH